MIVGYYSDRAPRVSLLVFGPRGSTEVEFVVDTAFDGDAAMPSDIL
jgi:hypothetical protein